MYNKSSSSDVAKNLCKDLRLPWNFCQLLSPDRSVCLVNDDWIKSLHAGQLIPISGTEEVDPCQVERFLSRSCDKIPLPWMKVSIKVISKSDEQYHPLPGQHLLKQWSCGSLFEFMSHITKENMTNLWMRAQTQLRGNISQYPGIKNEDPLSYTDVVKELLRRLQKLTYISLLPDKNASSENHRQLVTSSDSKIGNNDTLDNGSNFRTGSSNREGSFYTTSDTQSCRGVVPIDVVIESENYFYIVQQYYQFTLRDAVTFSPSILETSHAKPLFVVYQLLHAMHGLHCHGLRMGDVRLCDIVMDKNMWLRITSPRLSTLKHYVAPTATTNSHSLFTAADSSDPTNGSSCVPLLQDVHSYLSDQTPGSASNSEKLYEIACSFMKAQQFRYYEITMLDSIVNAWVHRHITNFQYLMILNHLAGRRMGDPNNHPVLPWVLDFSAPDSGYRDLTKSKFRLNKGDGQLDFMYSGMFGMSDLGDHVPHHVSDILSDITYYVYKARRTPKHILCAHVRSNWVPHEYPISMQRLQDWTPDECIPEFFTDPSIFESIHEDLPDLEIPPWSKNTVDFVVRHLAALESEHVSSHLHHWIDLTFGYKLSGPAAVKAKNVHLHLVDHHTHLASHGAAQLFQQPHPQRKPQQIGTSLLPPKITRGQLNTQLMTYGMPDSESDSQYADASFDSTELGRVNKAAIHLPKNYNPVAELEHCEALQEFKAKALHVNVANTPALKSAIPPKYQDEGITEDMVTFLCLVCEMFLNAKLRMQDTHPPLWKRFRTVQRLCFADVSAIQRPFQQFVCDMFQCLEVTADKKMYFQALFPDGSPPPTPGFLIQTYSDLIPFPPYFAELYSCITKMEEKTREIEILKKKRLPNLEKANKIKLLEREKVPLLRTFLWNHQSYVGSEGMGLILPYIQDLLHNEYTTVQAAWSLFDCSTRELGPLESTKQFLPFMTALFSGEMSSAKHIKLYHRSFLVQLIVRLGLDTFLTYFSTLLVEAVAGYKDFSLSSRVNTEELLDELEQDNILKPSSTKSKSWAEDEYTGYEDYRDSTAETDEPLYTVFDDKVEVPEADGIDGSKRSIDNDDGDLVDQLLLDGAHILLGDENLDCEQKTFQGDASERDSLGSESSDDRADLATAKRRISALEDQDDIGSEPYENADQHSIHSISHIMTKSLEDSPTVFDDLDHFGAFQDGEVELRPEECPHLSSKSADTYEPQTEERRQRRNWNTESSESDSVNEEDRIERSASEDVNSSNTFSTSSSKISERMSETDTEKTNRHSKHRDTVSFQGTTVNSIISSSKNSTSGSNIELKEFELDSDNTEFNDQNSELSSVTYSDEVDAKQTLQDSSKSDTYPKLRRVSDMVRSETEDLMVNLSLSSSGNITNIRDIAADSVKWLSHKLGPVLATKFLSRNLVRMLALCYLGQEQLQFVEQSDENIIKTSRLVVGDKNSHKVLECIGFTVVLYGEQVILIQCLRSIMDMIKMAQKRLSPRAEGGLIASLVLLSYLVPYLSDTNLMNLLEESIIYKCISPVLSIVTTPTVSFPTGALARLVLCHKLIDLLYILGLRLGLEMTRKYLTSCMQQLFDTFSIVHGGSYAASESIPMELSLENGSGGSDESFLTIKMDPLTQQYKIGSPVDLKILKSSPKRNLSNIHSLSSVGIIDEKDDYVDPRSPSTTAEKSAQELKSVFSPELAQACYIPLCRIFGSIHMEEQLHNEDLIRRLCSQHDAETDLATPTGQEGCSSVYATVHPSDDLMTPTEERSYDAEVGNNMSFTSNRIHLNISSPPTPTQQEVGQFGRGYRHSGILSIQVDDLRSSDIEQNKSRHLRGHWLAYWERELGLHERDTMFNFMQIELQTYLGHANSSIRSLHTMDTENCFISACKDKTVRLWSINSSGDGMNKQNCQYCYSRHKKSVFSVVYVDSMRLVASSDGTVHIWDPYTGVAVSQLESPKYAPVVALTALPAPSTLVALATSEATLRFLDMRTSKYAHEFRCSVGSTGLIRCVVVSPDSNWVAVGFSTGLIYILDVNSGMFLHYWKAHDGEILQLKAYSKSRLLSSALDQTIKLWNVDTGQEVCPTKSQSEPVHCLSIYRDQLLTATTANKISVYASVTDTTAFTSSKLRAGSFKGVLTCMSVLPLNKALLLGSDNGVIRLMA